MNDQAAEFVLAPEVAQAQRQLGKGLVGSAEQTLQQWLKRAPEDIEGRYALAVAQRHLHQWEKALATLSAIDRDRPGFGRAYQEAGYNHVALRDFAKARSAFEQATHFDPGLVNSWKSLARLYEEQGEADKLASVQEQLDYLQALPPELIAVLSYLSEDRLAEAEAQCKHFLRQNKTHIEGMRLLAEIATRSKVHEDAEFLLETCLELAPEHQAARVQYGNLLVKIQKFGKAVEVADALLAENPGHIPAIRLLHAQAHSGAGRPEAAQESFRVLMRQEPENPQHPMHLGHALQAAGDLDGAVALFHQAAALKPDHGDAWWSLANTKTYRFTDDELTRMAALEAASGTGALDRVQLCFALGSGWEQGRVYEKAFHWYDRGNALKRPTTRHRPARLEARVQSQIDICTADLFAERQGLGLAAPDPIFIVGLPRAGSTLLEQILASHTQVDGTMELHNILNLAKRLRGREEVAGEPRYPQALAELEASYFGRFGQQFIDDTRAYRGDAPFFIDKMPNNFFHIGLIKLILPNAKVIDARRHPMACCFSGFKQLFAEGQEFSYSLTDIGNYYRQYVRLMAHWDAVLPGFVLRVQHEDLVADLEGQVHRLLDFCGLPFEPACLEFHRTERNVRTPSSAQVRQPIYSSGLEQWRHFEPWLGPLKEALGPELRHHHGLEDQGL